MLPQEIEFEIFLMLPVRSLCRFKCVCIRWRITIESDEFTEKHYALQNNSLLVRFNRYTSTRMHPNVTTFEHLYTPAPKLYTEDVGPCRGLFLLFKVFLDNVDRQALYNPATGAFRLLPRMPYKPEPFTMRYVCGLSWDPLSNDYKVVYYHYYRQVAMVYTFSSNSWRFCPNVPDCDLNPIGYANTNDFFYWHSNSEDDPSIVSFDMAQEVFAALNRPPDINGFDNYYSTLSTYHDSLAFVALKREADIEVWVLEQQQQQQQQHSWTKVFSFRQRTPVYSAEGIWNDTHVLFVTKHKTVEHVQTLVSYDMNNRKKDKVILGFKGTVFPNYKESLFWVKGEEGSPASSPHLYSFLQKPGTDELE